jgi:cytochrome c oxidase cbb3-type subunit 3
MKFAAITAGVLLSPLVWAGQADTTVMQGKAVFRSNCAFCHGLEGRGGRGPDLVSGNLAHGNSEAALRKVIARGVPGATMPAFSEFSGDELDALIRFLQHLRGAAAQRTGPVPGDAAKGRQVYARSGCPACHRIGTEGSIYGPDLSRIGVARSYDYLRQSILEPSADVPETWYGVTVVTKDGKRITGVRINEDTFTVQLRDPSQRFRMFQKDELKEVIHKSKSLMPAYGKLSKKDLTDLLAYLASLRGDLQPSGIVRKAEGIR